MANNCYYRMRVRGTRDDVADFIKVIQCDYNYTNNTFTFDRHLSRVFEACVEDVEDDNEQSTTITISGDCAWSVYSCMMEGEHTYFNDDKNNPNSQRSSLIIESKLLNLEIEVYSEETGCEFQEHFIIKNGEVLENDCVKYQEFYYDGEFDEELGITDDEITQELVDRINEEYNTDFEVDDYDGDYFRKGGFEWTFEF